VAALRPALESGWSVSLITWSVLVLEVFLAMALLTSKRHWPWLLAGGLALHAGIIVAHGLVSFGVVMMAALILFLRPVELELKLSNARDRGAHFVRSVRSTLPVRASISKVTPTGRW
jgi:hypothetical protein